MIYFYRRKQTRNLTPTEEELYSYRRALLLQKGFTPTEEQIRSFTSTEENKREALLLQKGLGFRVYGLGFRVYGLRLRVYWFRV